MLAVAFFVLHRTLKRASMAMGLHEHRTPVLSGKLPYWTEGFYLRTLNIASSFARQRLCGWRRCNWWVHCGNNWSFIASGAHHP